MSYENKVKPKSKSRAKVKKYIARILIFLCFVLFIAFCYEEIEKYRDGKKYPPVGSMVEVNNHKIHVFSKGEGKKTVVFSPGWGVACPYADFYPLMNEVSKYAKTVIYDRPGYGWSEVTDASRDIDEIAKEMHEALVKSGAKPPYILVGHSLGCLEVLRYTQMYHDEVDGVVLIDGRSPEYVDNREPKYLLNKLLLESGIARVLFNTTNLYDSVTQSRNNLKLLPENLIEMDKAMLLKKEFNKNMLDEGKNVAKNSSTVITNGKLGETPLRILSSESNIQNDEQWKKTQEDLTKWSTNSKQTTIKGTKHYIHLYYPERVSEEIYELVK